MLQFFIGSGQLRDLVHGGVELLLQLHKGHVRADDGDVAAIAAAAVVVSVVSAAG